MRPVHSPRSRPLRARFPWGFGVVAALVSLPSPLDAQYFGRNKVQHDEFEMRILTTPHFDIHFYEGMDAAIEDASRMAERWYERFARLFQHEFIERKPILLYADHPDFQQTNAISGQLTEGTGGVTESLKNRVVLPFSGSYASTDHVLGHELVHAFQYNMAQSRRGGGLPALMQIPLWMIEGMAEYLSVGPEDPLTAMWLRDALLNDDFPTLLQMTRETRFFPYRFGQAFWTYVGGTYGDDAVVDLFRMAMVTGWEPAIGRVLGMSSDTLSARWRAAAEAQYRPRMQGKTAPGEVGTLLVSPATGGGEQNLTPAVSPDGEWIVFMSEKDLFSFDLYLANARTGEIVRKLASASADPHSDALRFIDSAGTWSPDGTRVAIVAFANGRNEILIVRAEDGETEDRIALPDRIGEVTNPNYSPDGRFLVFSGQAGGTTDLYTYEFETGNVAQLTNDRHGDLQPVYSPDGRTIAFVTDRGPETDFDRLTYSDMRLALLDLADGSVRVLDIFGNVRHSNPQFSPDGQSLYFLSDPDGFSDIYRIDLATGVTYRVTEVATGVSGIVPLSPAMTVARETGTVVFSVFDRFQYHLYSMDSRDAPAAPVTVATFDAAGRRIPAGERRGVSRVEGYLADAETGLVAPGTFLASDAAAYAPSMSLDFLGQPMLGVGVDQFGSFVSGSAAAYFSDMLGNRQMGVAILANGGPKDLGGQFMYQNMERRWNWGVSAGRIPASFVGAEVESAGAGLVQYTETRYRQYWTEFMSLAAYPFSSTRRFEVSGGVSRVSADAERDVYVCTASFDVCQYQGREDASDELGDPINFARVGVALVGDNSFFGLTSPVRGSRFRVEVGTTVGNLNFHTLLADYRRYFNPVTELTFAFRGVHLGRYGGGLDSEGVLNEIYLGSSAFVRGYGYDSFGFNECTVSGNECTERRRLFGHRILLANAEARIPVLGVDRLGLIDMSFLPTELFFFTDAGIAWSDGTWGEVDFRWSRDSTARVPVVSTGVGARVNVLGFLVVEIYYAKPWQRPLKGAHWGFQIAPGW